MRLPRRFNLLNHRRRAIRTDLRIATEFPSIETQGNHRIPATALRLGDNPADGIIASRVELFPESVHDLLERQVEGGTVPNW